MIRDDVITYFVSRPGYTTPQRNGDDRKSVNSRGIRRALVSGICVIFLRYSLRPAVSGLLNFSFSLLLAF